MAVYANEAKDEVYRSIESSTGQFKVGILLTAVEIVKHVEQSRVGTNVAMKGASSLRTTIQGWWLWLWLWLKPRPAGRTENWRPVSGDRDELPARRAMEVHRDRRW